MTQEVRWWFRYGQEAHAIAWLRYIGATWIDDPPPKAIYPLPSGDTLKDAVVKYEEGRSTDNSRWKNDGELEFNLDQCGPEDD